MTHVVAENGRSRYETEMEEGGGGEEEEEEVVDGRVIELEGGEEAEEDPEDLTGDGHPVNKSADGRDALHHGIVITTKEVDAESKVFLASSTQETNSYLNGGSKKRG